MLAWCNFCAKHSLLNEVSTHKFVEEQTACPSGIPMAFCFGYVTGRPARSRARFGARQRAVYGIGIYGTKTKDHGSVPATDTAF